LFSLYTRKIQIFLLIWSSAKDEGRKATSKILEWCPPGRRKERPRNLWIKEATTGMREKGINKMGWIYREEWRRKLNFRHKKL
jgi:hypothetical protein